MCRYDTVTIIPFDMQEQPWYEALRDSLEEIFAVPVRYRPQIPLPQSAYDASRKQYAGEPFLQRLFSLERASGEILLGITREDLYASGMNFIFGLASPAGVCVIALKRLDDRFYGLPENHTRYFRRILTEAVHEIGHVLGLPHCENPRCVMHFSNSLADTDAKGYRFCPVCEKRVKEAICRR